MSVRVIFIDYIMILYTYICMCECVRDIFLLMIYYIYVCVYHNGRPLSYHRKLIEQEFEWFIIGMKAIQFKKFLWIIKVQSVGFYLINTSLPEVGIFSSIITIVIQVVRYYQISYNWFNESFAVSPRHVWLNIWDYHHQKL